MRIIALALTLLIMWTAVAAGEPAKRPSKVARQSFVEQFNELAASSDVPFLLKLGTPDTTLSVVVASSLLSPDPDSAESMAVSQIFRHAEGQNASITPDEIEVVTEHIVNQYKGVKHRGSNRTSSGPRPVRKTSPIGTQRRSPRETTSCPVLEPFAASPLQCRHGARLAGAMRSAAQPSSAARFEAGDGGE